jgi:valyl-tRNA synthetase
MLAKQYNPNDVEPRLEKTWRENGIYHFSSDQTDPVYSIDTPPPTVSGHLHLGHVYSYSHADFIARFQRMRGYRVFYPMGYDDNGLPTERYVEKRLGIRPAQVGREKFIEECLRLSLEAEAEYQALWQRLGLSCDWRYSYRTIDQHSRLISQYSFTDLYNKGLIYRQAAPAIWCPECQTSIAQAELNDLDRRSEYITLPFRKLDGGFIPIATTRPELLPACVAVFIHPLDKRYTDLAGETLVVPFYNQHVPVLIDPAADPEKGTGAVMCCTFGDTVDVTWWRTHQLPMIDLLDRQGRLSQAADEFAGLKAGEARQRLVNALEEQGLILDRQSAEQSIRVHERCDTPVEYLIVPQWFVRVMDFKAEHMLAGGQTNWHPAHMQARYSSWVENLNWDWCISRQRTFGVPFPVWYCAQCGQVVLAELDQLPVNPETDRPNHACVCGSNDFIPEMDVMDVWATSSLTPQIVGGWLPPGGQGTDESLYGQVFPFSLRPQAHEIIRTWAYYTIVKSLAHFNEIPWRNVLISGWGISGEGTGKISKSRGGGPMPPWQMIERYSADAVRYWAASTAPGKDALISEEKIQLGTRLVNKIWNVARFAERFLSGYQPGRDDVNELPLTSADRWILARLQALVERATNWLSGYEYATAKSEIETFFWGDLADNYLEMSKQRLYDPSHPQHQAALFTLYNAFLTTLKLFAPFLPFVTEEVYLSMFAEENTKDGISSQRSIHNASWPNTNRILFDPTAIKYGEVLVAVASAVRRFKSENALALSHVLPTLHLKTADQTLAGWLSQARPDLMSITRALVIEVNPDSVMDSEIIYDENEMVVALA